MGIVLSGVFLTNSIEKHDNMQIIKGLLLVESTIKIAGPLQRIGFSGGKPLRDDVKAVVRKAIGTWPTPEKKSQKKNRRDS